MLVLTDKKFYLAATQCGSAYLRATDKVFIGSLGDKHLNPADAGEDDVVITDLEDVREAAGSLLKADTAIKVAKSICTVLVLIIFWLRVARGEDIMLIGVIFFALFAMLLGDFFSGKTKLVHDCAGNWVDLKSGRTNMATNCIIRERDANGDAIEGEIR